MFTGIVVERGVVAEPPPRLRLRAPAVAADAAVGDSVAVDGCCLTVTEIDGAVLAFDAVPETLRRTNLRRLQPGDEVNLEPALRAGDRMGGHVVQGHVDAVGSLRDVAAEADAVNMTFAAPEEVLRYVIEKGSITVNGVSLTVTGFDDAGFSVSVIPHTRQVTNLGGLAPGDPVNLEADLFGKYVERMQAGRAFQTG
jgi:riboflavin synthase